MVSGEAPRQNRTNTGQAPDEEAETGELVLLRETVRDALVHLYTPQFQPSALLYQVLECDPRAGPGPLQSHLLASIADLEPAGTTSATCRARRAFEALHKRFVQGLTQEETAEHLAISVRHLQRVQQDAIDTLASHLWERWLARQAGEPLNQGPDTLRGTSAQAHNWHAQADLELASLHASAPRVEADVGQTIRGVLELERVLAAKRGIELETKFVQPGLSAAIHPMALRQMLITAIARLAEHMSPGELAVYASLEGGEVRITLAGQAALDTQPTPEGLLRDIIVPPGAEVSISRQRHRIFVRLRVPHLDEHTVLVVEDNPDMVLFYRHCTAGTPYRIVHAAPGHDIVERAEELMPDIVVLDVMMPHVDGWQVLTHLHERSATRAIPVIICSVVKEEELALALGASRFLSKPVEPQEFVAALDQVLHLASAGVTPDPENSAAA